MKKCAAGLIKWGNKERFFQKHKEDKS